MKILTSYGKRQLKNREIDGKIILKPFFEKAGFEDLNSIITASINNPCVTEMCP
jgi:hypothetical protein